MTRTFTTEPGHRQPTPLFIGLIGPSSSGKTRSALRLAVGIQSVVGGEIAFINTEGRRGTMDLDKFKKADGSPAITLMSFDAPYASLDYLDAILQARASGAKTIVIDSLSHEHEQVGGMLDYQEQELTRMAGDDWRKRESMQMLAWSKPKAARRQLLTRGIMQADVNIIACFRAKETSKPVKVEGKTKVVALGFTPIAGDEFVYEMALSALLPPGSKGVPEWHPELPGEKLAVKRPDHLEKLVPDGEQLSEEIGARLATWARGDGPKAAVAKPTAHPSVAAQPDAVVFWSDQFAGSQDEDELKAQFKLAYAKKATFNEDDWAAIDGSYRRRKEVLSVVEGVEQ